MDDDNEEKYADRELREEVRKTVLKSLDLTPDPSEPTYEELLELDKYQMVPWDEAPPVPTTLPPEGARTGPAKRPATEKQAAASRSNGSRSAGPKTPEGKEKSKFNAVKHGLTARFFPNILKEGTPEWLEFEKVLLLLTEHYQPVGPIEEMLVQKIVVETIRLGRLIAREQSPSVLEGAFYWDMLQLVTRYQSAINRQLFEAIAQLERVQAARKAE